MQNTIEYAGNEEWVIWNGAHGLVTTVTIGRFEASGRAAWLDEPFDMVGPFNLDELEKNGRITFAASIVMSRQKWQDDQAALRRASLKLRCAAQERMTEEFARVYRDHSEYQVTHTRLGERQHREILNLPIDGKLESRQIKMAYRRLAQKAHPDVGGNNEQFIRITEARNALLECVS